MAAEAERVVQRRDPALGQLAGLAAHDVRVHVVVQVVDVDGRRGETVVQGQHGGDGLDAAGAAQQVAGHRLGGRDGDVVEVVAELLAERLQLGGVTLRGRGGVRVDVHDLGLVQLVALEQVGQRAGHAGAGGLGLGDVVGVRGQALAHGLAVDPGAAGLGVLDRLQDHHAGALAQDEAVAGLVVRAGRVLRVVVVLGHRHHAGERGDRQRVDRGLGAAGHHDVGAAGADHLDRVADRLGAGGTGGDGGVHTRAGADLQTDVGRRGVGHQHRDGVRGDLAGALLLQHVVLVEEGGHAADAGGDDGAQALGGELGGLVGGRGLVAGVGPGLAGRDHGELRRAVQLAGQRAGQDLAGLDGGARTDPNRQLLGPLLGQGRHTGLTGDQVLPGAGGVGAQRREGADTRDDHGAIFSGHWFLLLSRVRGVGGSRGRARPGAPVGRPGRLVGPARTSRADKVSRRRRAGRRTGWPNRASRSIRRC